MTVPAYPSMAELGGGVATIRSRLRRPLLVLADAGILAVALALAYLIRFELSLDSEWARRLLVQLPFVILLQLAVIHAVGIYSFVWRYVGLHELTAFLKAALLSVLPPLFLRLSLPSSYDEWKMPLSVILMDALLAFGGIAGVRLLRRAVYESRERQRRRRDSGRSDGEPVLLVGAGRAGALAVREIEGRGDAGIRPVGFVDDDPLKQGMTIRGVRVLGTTADLPRLARDLAVDQVIVTIAEAPAEVLHRIVAVCRREGIKARTIPAFHEVLQGRVAISRFRDVEIEDLLGREPVRIDAGEPGSFLADRTIMVTGAGGSIGRELARQILRFYPARLILYERAEPALFDVQRQLQEVRRGVDLRAVLGDVCDRSRLAHTLATFRPHVVFHAAAHKHVPLMEENPCEAVRNNVLGTWILAREAIAAGVDAFVLVSTDKAVRPSSVMGATKRLAELVCQHLAAESSVRFVTVRFGNVLGSAGSVVPTFREQIARGGPVTVTHPEMQRYFMTIPEAAQLVLQAATIGDGGDILVLDMGEPVRILELAERMIALSGFEPGKEVEIVFTGARPGEKLVEELELAGEEHAPTAHPKIFRGRLRSGGTAAVESGLARLAELVDAGDDDGVRELLQRVLPEAELGVGSQREEGRSRRTGLRGRSGAEPSSRTDLGPLPMSSADIGPQEVAAVVGVLGSGRLAMGHWTEELESRLASRAGVAHAVAVSSGTAALHLAVLGLGIGPGDEVLVPAFTFAASVNAALFVGARPVFVDVLPDTFTLDPADLERRVTPRSRAILAVDVFGHPVEWNEVLAVAGRHGLVVVDDSCEAIGAEYRGRPVGSFGAAATFAFYPNKQLTTGEGGALVTDRYELAKMAHSLRNQGRSSMGSWLEHERLGFNYRLDEMSAALGAVQLSRLDELLANRERVARLYLERLGGIDGIVLPRVKPYVRMSWFVFVVELAAAVDREALIAALEARGIPSRAYFPAAHLQPYVRERLGDLRGTLPVTEAVCRRTLALPFHGRMTADEVDRVAAALEAGLHAQSPRLTRERSA